jgi:hypothetical protein
MRNHEKMHITEVIAGGHKRQKARYPRGDIEASWPVLPARTGRESLSLSMPIQDTWPGDMIFAAITLELNEERLLAQLDHADETR